MKPVLLLSNGHGEDLSGAALGSQLRQRGVAVEALPLVGHGQAYRQAGIPVLGPTRDFSTGGLGYTSLAGRLTDLREGQFTYVLRLLGRLWRRRLRYRLVVAVGDLVPVLGAWLTGQESAVYLVAYSSHYEGRLRLPWPCGWLLKRPRVRTVWSRDQLTAKDLSEQLGRPVDFLGNPFLDPLLEGVEATAAGRPGEQPSGGATAASRPVVAVLPGSRLPEALGNLTLLLGVLERLPAANGGSGEAPILRAALVAALKPTAIAAAAAPLGWRFVQGDRAAGPEPAALQRQGRRLELHWNRFATVLASSDLVLAMSGTASEQAVALARPVLQLAGPGPQFTEGFAEAQRRLLGPGVQCAAGPVGQENTLAATARMLGSMLDRLADPVAGPTWRLELEAIAAERLGATGGSGRIAAAIQTILNSPKRALQGD
ncbi:MAG: lipid-A-disaccharide synthase-related protein [Cyanobacteria bacterium]|nr:lipid-A-disaccharide synthase-related protein [Cyanobacteriota bacterium]